MARLWAGALVVEAVDLVAQRGEYLGLDVDELAGELGGVRMVRDQALPHFQVFQEQVELFHHLAVGERVELALARFFTFGMIVASCIAVYNVYCCAKLSKKKTLPNGKKPVW